MSICSPNEQEVRGRIARIRDLPSLSGSLQRLVEIIHDEVASPDEMESLIRYDQSLSARILRVANSTYYGMRGNVPTLTKAMILIGFEQVKSLCLCALLMDMCSTQDSIELEERERLWKHSFATARVASEMARKRPWVSPEKAYILALFHDLGRVAMAFSLQDHYRAIWGLSRNGKIPLWYAELQYGLTHTVVGKWLATRWNLPEVFQMVMEFHHFPEKSPAFKAEVKLVALANILVNSRENPELLDDEITSVYRKDLFIPETEWEACRKRLQDIWAEVDQLWTLLR
ncbi:MAG: HDOD domain-containing protein [Syntrophobacteraceae bacterium]|nr:HDOD domain-containing protein [Syntrophobacteraceae bacterium]